MPVVCTTRQGSTRTNPLLWFSWARTGEAGHAGSGRAGVNHLSRLQSAEIGPHGLVPGPGVILRKWDSGLTCKSSMEEAVGGYGPWIGWFAWEGHALGGVLCYL